MFSVATMWVMTLWLLVEATNRFFEPPKVHGWIMLLVACIGLVFNLIQIKILHTGDGHYHLGGEHGHDHHGHSHHGHSHGHDHDESEQNSNHSHKHQPTAHNHDLENSHSQGEIELKSAS